MPYQTGDRISHNEYGEGTIKKVTGHESAQSLLIAFDAMNPLLHNGGMGPGYDNRCYWCSTARIKPLTEVK